MWRHSSAASLERCFGLLGHGSLTSCMFLADPARGLVITQVRKTAGKRFGDWSFKFFRAIADGLLAEGDGR